MACITYVVCDGSVTVTFDPPHVAGVKVITGAGDGPFHAIRPDGGPIGGPTGPGPGPESRERLASAMLALRNASDQVNSVAREIGAHTK
ncbi:MAG: hypothetical protein AUH69_02370 [Actinobacteria bacterium 13_1_40CM_4_65_12]|nr:MAG: hypothetical protein AUH69_02370 [Actinobacteria bacterium 13_1_40CM_4_65_12]